VTLESAGVAGPLTATAVCLVRAIGGAAVVARGSQVA
jgi:hypothetical protein